MLQTSLKVQFNSITTVHHKDDYKDDATPVAEQNKPHDNRIYCMANGNSVRYNMTACGMCRDRMWE